MLLKKTILIIFTTFCFVFVAFGQQSLPDSLSSTLEKTSALAFYKKTIGHSSPLYTGREYLGYDRKIEGHQYFDTEQAYKGSLTYDKIFYGDVLMRYDLVKDQLIVTYPDNDFKIIIKKEYVEWFEIEGHLFINLQTKQLEGFYDIINNGKIQVLVKRIKVIEEEIRDSDLKRSFIEKNRYYIRNEHETYAVSSKKNLLNYFKNDKKEIRKMLKKHKIKYRKDPELAITLAVQFMEEKSHL